uniref:Uncharacterized protein n=1 Tax=Arundo donax TaxID=35708 RepID=A0A0A9ADJ3_ARUDO
MTCLAITFDSSKNFWGQHIISCAGIWDLNLITGCCFLFSRNCCAVDICESERFRLLAILWMLEFQNAAVNLLRVSCGSVVVLLLLE